MILPKAQKQRHTLNQSSLSTLCLSSEEALLPFELINYGFIIMRLTIDLFALSVV